MGIAYAVSIIDVGASLKALYREGIMEVHVVLYCKLTIESQTENRRNKAMNDECKLSRAAHRGPKKAPGR